MTVEIAYRRACMYTWFPLTIWYSGRGYTFIIELGVANFPANPRFVSEWLSFIALVLYRIGAVASQS